MSAGSDMVCACRAGQHLGKCRGMGALMPAFLRKMLAPLQGAAESTGDMTGEAGKK